MFVYLFVLYVLLCILHLIFKYSKNVRVIRKIPGDRETFLVGNALDILVSPVELFNYGRQLAKKFNGIYSWTAFTITGVNIYNPKDIETVTSSMKHSKKSKVYVIMSAWLKQGLLLSSGSKWQARRKILVPAFHFAILRQFFTVLEENGQRFQDVLEKTQEQAVDIIPLISEYTLNSICETAMGTKLQDTTSNEAKIYKKSIYEMGKVCVERFTKIYYMSEFIFQMSSPGRKMKKHLDIVKRFTKNVIMERKQYVEKHGIKTEDLVDDDGEISISSKKKKRIAMLDLLILAEQDGVIDSAGIQEEVDTFMFEGHDTTASGLTFFFMLLANHKDIQDKIYAELREIFGDSDRMATMEDLSKMRYMDCCIKESLRLYPPVPFISREITETVELSDYTVPEGTDCHIHIYDLHRREDLYKNPSTFDPDRFLPENSVGRHPYAYIPFSAGPRNCIGQRFAIMEMKSCTVAVLRKFELHHVTLPTDIQFISDLVLRCVNPVYVKFVKRNKH